MTFSIHCKALVLAAQELPKGTALAIMVFFGLVAALSTVGLCSSNKSLSDPELAKWIGTSNPRKARIACAIGAIVGYGAVGLSFASLIGKI